jgi:hypothetical protein
MCQASSTSSTGGVSGPLPDVICQWRGNSAEASQIRIHDELLHIFNAILALFHLQL